MTVARLFTLLVFLWVASEFGIWLFRRSKSGRSTGQFSVSNLVLWGLVGVSLCAAFLARRLSWAHIGGSSQSLLFVAIVVLLVGIAIRWWAIVALGRFFTSDLAVQAGHRIVQTGPYRWVRHPSYTGLLVAFLGAGLAMYNWVSVVGMLAPVTAAIVYRVHVEEKMLEREFGTAYAEYRERTCRLLPGIF